MPEVFNNLFMSITEQMGGVLKNTSYSVNIKEQLDFSCAVFPADSSLVANAPPHASATKPLLWRSSCLRSSSGPLRRITSHWNLGPP